MKAIVITVLSAIFMFPIIACIGTTSSGGSGSSSCGTNCTLTGTWSAWAEVSCASSKPSCGYGVVDSKGNLPTIGLPTNYGVLSNVTSGQDAGDAAVITINISNAEGQIVQTGNTCPTLYLLNATELEFALQQGAPMTCGFTVETENSNKQLTGQSVTISYSGPE